MLKITNLSLRYKDSEPLFDNANLEIDSGLWLVAGPNGSGKTTLLELLSTGKNDLLARCEIGDGLHITKPLKVMHFNQDVVIPNVFEKDLAELIFELNDVVVEGFEPIYANKTLNAYSTGEKKLAVIKILSFLEPELLLFDEYIENFDDDNLDRIFAILNAMADSGATILVASNEKDVKRRFANAIVIKNGKLAPRVERE
jgi:ABC-type multidrug transport system ATPase subunit